MTKLEELRKALEAATPGEWDACRHATPEYHPQFGVFVHEDPNDFAIVNGEANAAVIALAHNLMPQLLEAVELIEDVALGNSEYDDLSERAAELLGKLK